MGRLPFFRQVQALASPRQKRAINQTIVFQKAQEHAAENPMDDRLVEDAIEERFKRVSGTAEIKSLAPLSLHGVSLRPCGVDGAQVSIEHLS